MKLWTFLKEQMMRNPGQKVCEGNAEMSYEKLVIFAEQFAEKIRGATCCGLLCQSEMAQAMALLGCFAAEVTALPLSYRYGTKHCKKIAEAIRPDLMVTDENGTFRFYDLADAEYVPPREAPALIMCTSGTTGSPKGIMLTDRNIVTNIRDICRYLDVDTFDTILIARPLYHCAVLTGEFLTGLVKGAEIRFYSGTFDPVGMLKMIREHRITTFCGTPTLLGMMARMKTEEDLPLRRICISGECMGREVGLRIAEAFPKAEIYHVYGLTEACPRVSYLPPELFCDFPDCVGLPLKSVVLEIRKEDGTAAGINEIGTLWVRGENIMAGYYNDPERTQKVLQDGWLCTGDLALANDAGLLKILGRVDDLIIKAGMNIYPQEIENAVRQDPRVREVCVRGETDERLGTRIIMDIAGDFADTAEVKQLCKQCLSPYQIPTKINLLKELPKNGSGKIKRRK